MAEIGLSDVQRRWFEKKEAVLQLDQELGERLARLELRPEQRVRDVEQRIADAKDAYVVGNIELDEFEHRCEEALQA